MSSPESKKYRYLTKIWKEVPEQDDPFSAKQCLCYGYDVYGEIIHKASWFEYLFLMFKGERPSPQQSALLEKLALVLANPGPREASVRAAMNGGNGGSTEAASLMAALAVGAGQYGGAQELKRCVENFAVCGQNIDLWVGAIKQPNKGYVEDIWRPFEHPPGFDPNALVFSTSLRNALTTLASCELSPSLRWLSDNKERLEDLAGCPVAKTLIAAAAFTDLGFQTKQACMLFLILTLPGAAAHALEQETLGWKNFPFYADAIILEEDPGFKGIPDTKEFGL